LTLTNENLQTKILYHDFEVFAMEKAFFDRKTLSITAEHTKEIKSGSA